MLSPLRYSCGLILCGLKFMRLPRCVPMKDGQRLNLDPGSSPSSSLLNASRVNFVVVLASLSLCGRRTMTCSMRGVLSRLVDFVADLLSPSTCWAFDSIFERASSAYISILSGSGCLGVLLDFPNARPSWAFYRPPWLASDLPGAFY